MRSKCRCRKGAGNYQKYVSCKQHYQNECSDFKTDANEIAFQVCFTKIPSNLKLSLYITITKKYPIVPANIEIKDQIGVDEASHNELQRIIKAYNAESKEGKLNLFECLISLNHIFQPLTECNSPKKASSVEGDKEKDEIAITPFKLKEDSFHISNRSPNPSFQFFKCDKDMSTIPSDIEKKDNEGSSRY
jgi:hypothetical protein